MEKRNEWGVAKRREARAKRRREVPSAVRGTRVDSTRSASRKAFRKRKNATRTVIEGSTVCHCDEHYASRRAKRKQCPVRQSLSLPYARIFSSRAAAPPAEATFFAPGGVGARSSRLYFLIIKTVNTTSERDLRSRIRCPARKTGATPLAASFSSLPRRRRREKSLPRVRLEKLVSSPPRRVLFIHYLYTIYTTSFVHFAGCSSAETLFMDANF